LDDPDARNNPAHIGIQYSVFVTSRWFPLILALLQTARHVGLIGYDYWAAAHNDKRFDLGEFLQRDLARPLFEPYGFCGAWAHYSSGQSAVLGLDLPSFIAATLLHSAINWRASCVDALTTPRGQIITAALVPVTWFFIGLSIRRLAQRRWRQRTTGRFFRTVASLGLLLVPLGLLGLLFAVVSLFVSDIGSSLRLAGLAFWMLYLATLIAERLRVWPFARTDTPMQALLPERAQRDARRL
jgi:hypothetical protein